MKFMLLLTVEERLQDELIKILHTPLPKKEKTSSIHSNTSSPSLERELTKIQSMNLKGKNAMYMMDLDDFCLD